MVYKIDKSKIHGDGLLATSSIPNNTDVGLTHMSIGTVNGKLIIGDITELGRFSNHSVEPNCEYRVIKKNIYLFTIRDIDVGEELVVDYNRNKEISVNLELDVDSYTKKVVYYSTRLR